MDITGSFKTLNAITPFRFHFHFRPRSLLLRPRHFHSSLSFSKRFSPFCSLSETGNGNSLPHGAGEAVSGVSRNKLLQVVLVSPQIPGNTGCIARTCAASGVGLHLVGDGNKRLLAFTKRGTATHSEFSYKKGDYLVFGSETSGLPPEALEDCKNETLRIPMIQTYVRCLNLSVSVGIALYEASRQLNYEQLNWTDAHKSLFITEDIFT
ncbi:uncharacterized protein [Euphorbia lathyris]|uniref:uncharacterized protein isoform X2 n=1 Tax=Euphorbia lathyris TaxID=212925 RepID=UPI003314163E